MEPAFDRFVPARSSSRLDGAGELAARFGAPGPTAAGGGVERWVATAAAAAAAGGPGGAAARQASVSDNPPSANISWVQGTGVSAGRLHGHLLQRELLGADGGDFARLAPLDDVSGTPTALTATAHDLVIAAAAAAVGGRPSLDGAAGRGGLATHAAAAPGGASGALRPFRGHGARTPVGRGGGTGGAARSPRSSARGGGAGSGGGWRGQAASAAGALLLARDDDDDGALAVGGGDWLAAATDENAAAANAAGGAARDRGARTGAAPLVTGLAAAARAMAATPTPPRQRLLRFASAPRLVGPLVIEGGLRDLGLGGVGDGDDGREEAEDDLSSSGGGRAPLADVRGGGSWGDGDGGAAVGGGGGGVPGAWTASADTSTSFGTGDGEAGAQAADARVRPRAVPPPSPFSTPPRRGAAGGSATPGRGASAAGSPYTASSSSSSLRSVPLARSASFASLGGASAGSRDGATLGGASAAGARGPGGDAGRTPTRHASFVAAHSQLRARGATPLDSATSDLLAAPRKLKRYIHRCPFKVLDAPSLVDDFYLNLVDWGARDAVVVGLGADIYVWEAASGRVALVAKLANGETAASVAWTQRGNHIAVGTSAGAVNIYDVAAGKHIRAMGGHTERASAVAWAAHTLASGSKDCSLLLRDVRTPHDFEARLEGHRQEICGVAWAPDWAHLASGGNDNRVVVWSAAHIRAGIGSLSSGVSAGAGVHEGHRAGSTAGTTPLWRFKQHTAAVKALAWSPHKAGILASGGGTQDRCIRIFSTSTGEQISSIDTGSQVCSLLWSTNTVELVSTHGYMVHTLCLWRYPSMAKIATLSGHTQRVLYSSLSPSGECVVTGAGDETLRFWNLFPPGPAGSTLPREEGDTPFAGPGGPGAGAGLLLPITGGGGLASPGYLGGGGGAYASPGGGARGGPGLLSSLGDVR